MILGGYFHFQKGKTKPHPLIHAGKKSFRGFWKEKTQPAKKCFVAYLCHIPLKKRPFAPFFNNFNFVEYPQMEEKKGDKQAVAA